MAADRCKDCGVVPYLESEERECWACGGCGEEAPFEPCDICGGDGVLMRDELVCECDPNDDDQANEEGWAADGR